MAGNLTPTMMIAADGMFKGTGIGPADLSFADFADAPYTTIYKTITAGDTSAITGLDDALDSLPSFLTGKYNGSDLPTDVRTHANKIFPGGVDGIRKFSAVIGTCSGFLAVSFNWGGALTGTANKSFGDFGISQSKYKDLVSGGLSSLFKINALPGTTVPGPADVVKSLKETFANFGTAYDTTDMSKLGDPATFITNLQKQGLGTIGGIDEKIIAAGGDVNSIHPNKLKSILSSVSGGDLQKIITETKFVSPQGTKLNSLADMLEPTMVLPKTVQYLVPNGATLNDLGNKFVDLGGKFAKPADVSNFLASAEVESFQHLDTLKSPVPADVAGSLAPKLGVGSNPFGGPIMLDMIGSVAGYPHKDSFTKAATLQAELKATTIGETLFQTLTDLSAALGDPTTADPLVVTLTENITSLTSSTDPKIVKILADGNTAIVTSASQIPKEVSNLELAGLDLNELVASPGSLPILSMVSQLHTFGQDKNNSGFNDIFKTLSTNDAAGDAVRACLIEGRNISRQSTVGIQNVTKIDAQKVASSLG